jgi:hypothetical protein
MVKRWNPEKRRFVDGFLLRILILIFAEALGLYGLIVGLVGSQWVPVGHIGDGVHAVMGQGAICEFFNGWYPQTLGFSEGI